uniref:Uncharacterized protein n=1 Tax=Chromera velia CCMP2878 TaxID=1169474 RepID=A0A0G4IAF2_9ALVE|mmetsp:Transcript_36654/g.72080  ORF Transcript_36654/g.72080 Transcript_36654/m.72080 type:complete len:252 (+) Transcript_36654:328-1083(+)|eukprot:Cvel_2110.t1-p1 / transcript=Cvel_2110.t1 / gene=Cvel_2110 / organism=Chromera_velia_CCMP2878 / gene_product=hypothetical protein / transcript_product=hypothetical protein / location=Cvel_scaffold81:121682-125886(+) / protein_length=251 / sequence_SO=supercontig / SO=protein_coding / is_pseudo=false
MFSKCCPCNNDGKRYTDQPSVVVTPTDKVNYPTSYPKQSTTDASGTLRGLNDAEAEAQGMNLTGPGDGEEQGGGELDGTGRSLDITRGLTTHLASQPTFAHVGGQNGNFEEMDSQQKELTKAQLKKLVIQYVAKLKAGLPVHTFETQKEGGKLVACTMYLSSDKKTVILSNGEGSRKFDLSGMNSIKREVDQETAPEGCSIPESLFLMRFHQEDLYLSVEDPTEKANLYSVLKVVWLVLQRTAAGSPRATP